MRLLQATYAILGVFRGAYFALWMPKLQARGFSLSQIALLFSIEIAISTVLNLPLGAVADRIGHKKVSLAGFFIYLIAVLFPAISPSPLALALGVVLIGIGNSLVSGAMESWAADVQTAHVGDLKAEHFIGRDQVQRAGIILGSICIPLTVSFLLKESPTGTWVLFSVVALTLLGVSFVTPDGKPIIQEHHSVEPFFQSLKSLLAKPGVIALSTAWVFFGISNGAVDLSFYPRLTQEFGLSASWIFGIIQAFVSLSRLGGSELWKRSRWINSWRIPGIAMLGSAVCFLTYGFTANPTIAIILWLIRVAVLSAYFSTVVSSVLSVKTLRASRATVLSLASVAAATGEFGFTGTLSIYSLQPDKIALLGACAAALAGVFLLKGSARICA